MKTRQSRSNSSCMIKLSENAVCFMQLSGSQVHASTPPPHALRFYGHLGGLGRVFKAQHAVVLTTAKQVVCNWFDLTTSGAGLRESKVAPHDAVNSSGCTAHKTVWAMRLLIERPCQNNTTCHGDHIGSAFKIVNLHANRFDN
jgi:hypothetical protein